MNLFGTNYAEQVEAQVPKIFDLYKSDLLHAGIKKRRAKTRFSTMNNKIKKEIPAPMYELLQDYTLLDLQWYKKTKIPSRVSTNIEREWFVKKQEDDSLYSRPRKSHGSVIMDDILLDEVYLNERRHLVKDIAFTRPITTNVTPVEFTHNRLYEVLKVKTLLTTKHLIKKRTLSYQIGLQDILKNIYQTCTKYLLI